MEEIIHEEGYIKYVVPVPLLLLTFGSNPSLAVCRGPLEIPFDIDLTKTKENAPVLENYDGDLYIIK